MSEQEQERHARCACCRSDTGMLLPRPHLCDDCTALVVPSGDGWWRLGYAAGYAAAVWAQKMGKSL